MEQRYASMPTARLRKLLAMLRGTPQAEIIARLLDGRTNLPERADGGSTAPKGTPQTPWWTGTKAYQDNKPMLFLHGSTPGRADLVHTVAPGGAHIIPADVVSGLGEGNSLNGAAELEKRLASGPYGAPLHPTKVRQMGPHGSAVGGRTKGGKVAGHDHGTPVALSDGEAMVFPHWVAHLGGGDPKVGRGLLNEFIVRERRRNIKKLKSLPGPVKEGTR